MALQQVYDNAQISAQTAPVPAAAPQIVLRIDYNPTGRAPTCLTARMTQTHVLRARAAAHAGHVVPMTPRTARH